MDPNRATVEGPEQNNNERDDLDLNLLEVAIIPNDHPTVNSDTEEQETTVNTSTAIPLPPPPTRAIPLPPPPPLTEHYEISLEDFQLFTLFDNYVQFTPTVNTSPVNTYPPISGPTTTTASASNPLSSASYWLHDRESSQNVPAEPQPGPSGAIQQQPESELMGFVPLSPPPSLILGLPPRPPRRPNRRISQPTISTRLAGIRELLRRDSAVVEEARMPPLAVRRPELDEDEESSPESESDFQRLTIHHLDFDDTDEESGSDININPEPDMNINPEPEININPEPDMNINPEPDININPEPECSLNNPAVADEGQRQGQGNVETPQLTEEEAHENRMSYLRNVSREYIPETEWMYDDVEDILDKKSKPSP